MRYKICLLFNSDKGLMSKLNTVALKTMFAGADPDVYSVAL